MQYLLYGFIVIIATTIGAMTGVGGGIVMKPAFDLLNYDVASLINVYSGFAVFSMCVISLIKRLKSNIQFDKTNVLSLAVGSVIGGWIGDQVFGHLANLYSNNFIRLIQNSTLLILLVLICIYTIQKSKFTHFHLKNVMGTLIIGLLIGMISVFLGIGGGPLNIAVLMIAYSYTTKEAGFYSLVMIFFAQLTKLLTNIPDYSTMGMNLPLVGLIIIMAILGGNIGTRLQFRLSDQQVEKGYLALMMVLMVICVYNVAAIIF